MSDFPCTQCGLCCKLVGHTLAFRPYWGDSFVGEAIDQFPYSVDENGVCEKFLDNKCSVYENRPLLCNVERLAILHGFDKDNWYRINAMTCNSLIKQAGLDESYLIKDYDLNQ